MAGLGSSGRITDLGTFAVYALEFIFTALYRPAGCPQEPIEVCDFDREPSTEIGDDVRLIGDRPLQQLVSR